MSPFVLAATFGDKLDSAFYSFDLGIFEIFGKIQCGFLTAVSKMITVLGDSVFVVAVAVLGLALCFFRRTRKYGFALVFAIVIGTAVTNLLLKPAVCRIRPYNTLQSCADYWSWYVGAGMLSESDYSFPSGHTTAAFEMAAALWLCFFTEGKKKIAWVFPAAAVLVMCSRVYLMVHYASDVLGGLLVGLAAGCLGFLLGLVACRVMDQSRFLNAIDAERLFRRGISKKAGVSAIIAVVAVFFCVSYAVLLTEGGEDAVRCEYDGDYDCQNEARVDDSDYPPIDGKSYCKIHWKQISGEN